MKVSKKIGQIAFKLRGAFWGVFAAGVLIFPGTFELRRFILGLVILLAGQALRLWAAGYIPKYRTEVIGAPVLVTWGPYKWVRNPLYAGNGIMGLGWALMVGWGWVIAFTIAFLLLYCLIVIPAEEEFLEEKFGEAYRDFKRNVPALIPFPRAGFPEKSPNEQPFDSKRAWAEEIYSIRMNIFVTAAIMVRLYFS
ncbi:isoprenylcysteine carboxylmethyltransferase family protein [Synergistaceae bacterium OttesenSCG-928-D05]|nr:isoprenylcysteine carboxylmethyltransferase family protein [Synergistaceae bacterium OttesenSCG-928-D05]